MLVARAPAKVNWTLEVFGRRPDGYHEVASVMSAVSLCDVLKLEPADSWRVTVDAPEPLKSELESGDNLVKLAIEEMVAAVGADVPAARIHLKKHIPAAAGLGGGSSDAAATLRLLWKFWDRLEPGGLAISALLDVAARLGSDVPFFLRCGTQLAHGRGEQLTPLGDPAGSWLILVTPPIALEHKTARLYSLISAGDYTDGRRSELLARRLASAAPPALDEDDLFNVFERVAPAAYPGIDAYRRRLTAAAGAPAHLCGAGPSLYALAANGDTARAAAALLRREELAAWAANVLPARQSLTLPQT